LFSSGFGDARVASLASAAVTGRPASQPASPANLVLAAFERRNTPLAIASAPPCCQPVRAGLVDTKAAITRTPRRAC